MTTGHERDYERESEQDKASEAEFAAQSTGRVAADPEAEEDNSPKSETSSSLLYLGLGVPFVLFVSTGIFGLTNGYTGFAFIGFGVAAALIVLAIILISRLVKANRGRSHH